MATVELVRLLLLGLDHRGKLIGFRSHYRIHCGLYVGDFARRLRQAAKFVLERTHLLVELLLRSLLVLERLLVFAGDARRGGKHLLKFLYSSLVDNNLLDDLLDGDFLDHFLLDYLLDLDGHFLDDFLFHYLLYRNLDNLLDNSLYGNFDNLLDDLWPWFDLCLRLRLMLMVDLRFRLRFRFRLRLGLDLWRGLWLRRWLRLQLWFDLRFELRLRLVARRGRVERLARLDHRRSRRKPSARDQRLRSGAVEGSAGIAVANVYREAHVEKRNILDTSPHFVVFGYLLPRLDPAETRPFYELLFAFRSECLVLRP